jgi:molecular chaperone GrpE (heat shock protein)
LAVSGSSSLVGIAVAALMRALPYLAASRAKLADAALVRAQTMLVKAQARKQSDDVVNGQLKEFREELIKQAVDAKERAERLEREMKTQSAAYEKIIAGMQSRIDDLERALYTIRTLPPPPLPIPEEQSSARIELVQRANGDHR